VQLVGGLVIGVAVPGSDMLFHPLVDRLEPSHVPGRLATNGLAGAARLEHGQDREQRVDFLRTEFGHEGTAAGSKPHQPLVGEHLQGLAQRCARGSELGGQVEFIDPVAGGQGAVEDHFAHAVGHFDMQRRTRNPLVEIHRRLILSGLALGNL